MLCPDGKRTSPGTFHASRLRPGSLACVPPWPAWQSQGGLAGRAARQAGQGFTFHASTPHGRAPSCLCRPSPAAAPPYPRGIATGSRSPASRCTACRIRMTSRHGAGSLRTSSAVAGVASTVLIVTTNTDYYVHEFFYEHEQYGNAAMPIIRTALYIPIVTGGSLFVYGKLKRDDRAVGASFAVIQSSLVAFVYNSLLKAVTGRPNPDWEHNPDMMDLSKTFRFGFLRGGIYWGWPSGHTSSLMAVVSALTNFYSEKTWLKVAGYSMVAYMMYGVSSLHRGGMHWFSDAVAAAFMSYAIGSTIGKYYRSKFQTPVDSQTSPLPIELPIMNIHFSF